MLFLLGDGWAVGCLQVCADVRVDGVVGEVKGDPHRSTCAQVGVGDAAVLL